MTSQNKPLKYEIDPEVGRFFQHPQSQAPVPTIPGGQVSVADLQAQIQALSQQVSQLQSKRVQFNTDIIGLFPTVSAAPTLTPNSPYQQIQIYVNSTTYRLYWYDGSANVWHYVTATA